MNLKNSAVQNKTQETTKEEQYQQLKRLNDNKFEFYTHLVLDFTSNFLECSFFNLKKKK